MNKILITHQIEESTITIQFNLLDGEINFPELSLNLNGDIDFSQLIFKMLEFIKNKNTIETDFIDNNNLIKPNSKINLIKETLEEIYDSYNKQILELGCPQDKIEDL